MLQFLDNLWRLFIFSDCIREIDHFTLDFLKRSSNNGGPSEKFLIVDHPKEDHNEREFKHLIIDGILDLLEQEKHQISGPQYYKYWTFSKYSLK